MSAYTGQPTQAANHGQQETSTAQMFVDSELQVSQPLTGEPNGTTLDGDQDRLNGEARALEENSSV